jgi:hypothetical protein
MELDHGEAPGAVRCVDWAPKMGRYVHRADWQTLALDPNRDCRAIVCRSFHYIATAQGRSYAYVRWLHALWQG